MHLEIRLVGLMSGIVDALDLFVTRVTRQLTGGEEGHVIRLGRCGRLARDNAADEGEDDLSSLRFGIHPSQPLHFHDQADLLLYLPDYRVPGSLAGLNTSTGTVPEIEIAPVAEEDVALFI